MPMGKARLRVEGWGDGHSRLVGMGLPICRWLKGGGKGRDKARKTGRCERRLALQATVKQFTFYMEPMEMA